MSRLAAVALIYLIVFLSSTIDCTTHCLFNNTLINLSRYIIAYGFIFSMLVWKEADLFIITKKNIGVLIYLVLVGLFCTINLILPKTMPSQPLNIVYPILTNPLIAIVFISMILKNPIRYGKSMGTMFSLLGFITFFLAQEASGEALVHKNTINDWIIFGLYFFCLAKYLVTRRYQSNVSQEQTPVSKLFDTAHKCWLCYDNKGEVHFKIKTQEGVD